MRRLLSRSFLLLGLLAVAACSDSPLTTEYEAPLWAISDAAHNGLDHFYFLPPMVPSPSPTGDFDATARPVVDICMVHSAGCTSIATYDMTTGPGSETVRLVAEEELHAVNWHTNQFNLAAATTYRIRVLVDGQERGFADVDVVNTGGELKNVATGLYVPLKDGRTLPIKFRIERFSDVEAPTAVIRALDTEGQPLEDDRVSFGTSFVLSGAQSFDTGGGSIVRYDWTLWDGTVVQTTDPTFAVTVDPAQPIPLGQHTFGLVVVDDSGNQSTPDQTIVVVVDEQAPTAVLEAPSSVSFGTSFALSGARSFDSGGGSIVRYEWTLWNGTVVQTTDPTFTVTVDPVLPIPLGQHTFGLVVVDDSDNRSTPSQATVLVVDDQAPTAVLDAPSSVSFGTSFVLSGARSFDSGGGSIVRYDWTLWDGTVVQTTDPTFTVTVDPAPPMPVGQHTFGLVVVDDVGNQSTPSQATVVVVDDQAPTAVLEGPSTVSFGTSFVMSGRRSFDSGGGSIVRYEWTLWNGAVVQTTDPTFTVTLDPVLPIPVGRHTFGLVVVDDSGNQSTPDQVTVIVVDDQAPTAVLDAPSSVPFGTSFALSGARSFDSGGGSIVRYEWTLWNGTVVQTTGPTLTVTVDPAQPIPLGQHTFGLVVVDDSGNQSRPDQVTVIVVDDQAPTAVLDAPSTVSFGTSFVMSGRRSFDSGGGSIVRYEWTLWNGETVVQTTDPTFTVTLDPVLPIPVGQHTFGLVVVDDSGNQSTPDQVTVVVVDDQAPTAVLEGPSTVSFGTSFVMSGRRSFDSGGGSIVRYEWTLWNGTVVQTTGPTLTVTVDPVLPIPVGQHTFGLVVVDDSGNRSSPDQATVTVISAGG